MSQHLSQRRGSGAVRRVSVRLKSLESGVPNVTAVGRLLRSRADFGRLPPPRGQSDETLRRSPTRSAVRGRVRRGGLTHTGGELPKDPDPTAALLMALQVARGERGRAARGRGDLKRKIPVHLSRSVRISIGPSLTRLLSLASEEIRQLGHRAAQLASLQGGDIG